jgi:hypothetical protein
VDIAANRIESTMPGLKEPQGVAGDPTTYVADGLDGSVRM